MILGKNIKIGEPQTQTALELTTNNNIFPIIIHMGKPSFVRKIQGHLLNLLFGSIIRVEMTDLDYELIDRLDRVI